jgi:hypothetical protein
MLQTLTIEACTHVLVFSIRDTADACIRLRQSIKTEPK